jgi:hypothetical protein
MILVGEYMGFCPLQQTAANAGVLFAEARFAGGRLALKADLWAMAYPKQHLKSENSMESSSLSVPLAFPEKAG